jgi:hypothetical protein
VGRSSSGRGYPLDALGTEAGGELGIPMVDGPFGVNIVFNMAEPMLKPQWLPGCSRPWSRGWPAIAIGVRPGISRQIKSIVYDLIVKINRHYVCR